MKLILIKRSCRKLPSVALRRGWAFSERLNGQPTVFSCYMITNVVRSSFGRASTPGQTQTGWGQGFILLLPQTAALPGSDAGSDIVQPALSFVLQNCQISMRCPMHGARC